VDLQSFSNKLAEATKNLSDAERASLKKIFEGVSAEVFKEGAAQPAPAAASCTQTAGIPDGPTERHLKLKENFLKQVPSVSVESARVMTEIAKANPGVHPATLRGMSFKASCEQAPLVIQDHELIVGNPTGAPRRGSFPNTQAK